MTELERIRTELVERGYTPVQANSKVVAGVLDILSESGYKYVTMDKLEKDIAELRTKIAELQEENDKYEQKVHLTKSNYDKIIQTINEKLSPERLEQNEYIDAFYKKLGEEYETQEGRDRLKIAQMFINTVDVKTPEDNTAFIIGLSAILSREIEPTSELRKITKKIPKVTVKEIDNETEFGHLKYGILAERIEEGEGKRWVKL